jgi:hypothetical protein
VKSTLPVPREKCGCAATRKLPVPELRPPLLSVLCFIPHHHWIGPLCTYLVLLNTSNMPPPKPPVENPIDIPFENGIILTTTINPLTHRHSIQCDLCEATIDLGISASGSNIRKHRNHEPCRRTVHKLRTQRARERIQVCMPRS